MTSYATPADLAKYGISAIALAPILLADQTDALAAASAEVASYLRSRYQFPLVSWGLDITRAVCKLAAYDLMCVRGYNPSLGADGNLQAQADAARAWLRSVARQEAQADVTPTQDQAPGYDAPSVATSAKRAW